MKVRNGFVSNSSSSSFLVLLEKKPRGLAHLRKLIFADPYDGVIERFIWEPHSDVTKERRVTPKELTEYLGIPEVGVIVNQKNTKALVTLISDAIQSGQPENILLSFNQPEYICEWYDKDGNLKSDEVINQEQEIDQFNSDRWSEGHAAHIAQELIKKYTGYYLCTFIASDNGDGIVGGIAEHGNIFKYLKFHLRFSQH